LASIPRKYKKILAYSLPLLAVFIVFVAYMYEHTSTTQYCATSCHIMKPAGETSFHSVHREENQVNCRDCHIPQNNIPVALVYKGYSGARDIYKNTFDPPDVLHTTEWSRKIIQENCIRCHQSVVERINTSDGKLCFECHRGEPHDKSPQTFSLQKISTPIR
jgi:cytochrome c nitrite reductase small subunit